MDLKIDSWYHIKKGYSRYEPECMVQLKKFPKDGESGLYTCLRSDGRDVYIELQRFVKELTKETHPEYWL